MINSEYLKYLAFGTCPTNIFRSFCVSGPLTLTIEMAEGKDPLDNA